MHRIVRRAVTTTGATIGALALFTGPALAHECFNTQKRAGSGGTVGTYDVESDTFTPSGTKGNPAFVEIVFPDGSSGFVFIHSASEVNGFVIPGAKDCDGKGLDNFSACFGG